jgi:hypothetical protein
MRKLIFIAILLISFSISAQNRPQLFGGGGTGATINDTAGNGDTTVIWSADKSYDEFVLKLNAANSPMTGDATLTDATPTFILNDSDNAAGTAGSFANSSGGANDIIWSFGVEDSAGASTEYFQIDGVTETIDFLKPVTLPNAGVIRPAASTDGHTFIIQAYGTNGSNNPELKNVITCTNDTAATANNLPECSINNVDLSLPLLSGDLSTTGAVTGGTKSINIGTTEGADDNGSSDILFLTDSGETFTSEYIGMTLYNISDVSSCTIGTVDTTNFYCEGYSAGVSSGLTGGTDNDWDNGDLWGVGPGPRQSNAMFYISANGTVIHPSTAGYTAGYFAVGDVTVKVDPASDSMTLNFDASGTYTDPGAGDEVDGPGKNGAFIIFHNRSATEAESFGSRGAWVDGGAS